MGASSPVGEPVMIQPRHLQNRVIREGDQFVLLVETTGPGGFFCEIGRTCVLGKATQSMKDEFAFAQEAQQFTVDMLKPGASCADVWNGYNEFMRKNGRPKENRLYCHGQGYHLVERPLVRFDETMRLAARMNIAVHPMYHSKDTYTWLCDNFLIGEHGAERLHASAGDRGAGVRFTQILIFPFFTTSAHCTSSLAMTRAYSSDVLPTGMISCAMHLLPHVVELDDRHGLVLQPFHDRRRRAGGRHQPCQNSTSMSPMPASAMVGTFG